jgi:multidrug resistance efflux pump
VGSQLSGQIARLFIDFNDEVKKGQPLAELDQRSFKLTFIAARKTAIRQVGRIGSGLAEPSWCSTRHK